MVAKNSAHLLELPNQIALRRHTTFLAAVPLVSAVFLLLCNDRSSAAPPSFGRQRACLIKCLEVAAASPLIVG